MADVVVILGHPDKDSYNGAIAKHYLHAMQKKGVSAELLALGDLDFDPVLRGGFQGKQALEPALQEARKKLEEARHLVWVYPTWWGHWPALMKGFVDRVFQPGWAFQNTGAALPEPLLKGRTARILSTMDSPWWWYWLAHGRAGHRALKTATLQYVGIKTIASETLYRCREQDEAQKTAWLKKVELMAQQDAGRILGTHRKQLLQGNATP